LNGRTVAASIQTGDLSLSWHGASREKPSTQRTRFLLKKPSGFIVVR